MRAPNPSTVLRIRVRRTTRPLAGRGRIARDTDQDGLFDDDETNVYGTNPKKADSDGDGRDDGQEVFDTTDPNNPND